MKRLIITIAVTALLIIPIYAFSGDSHEVETADTVSNESVVCNADENAFEMECSEVYGSSTYASFDELIEAETAKSTGTGLTEYVDFTEADTNAELHEIHVSNSSMTVVYTVESDENLVSANDAELERLLTSCKITWLFSDDVDVTLDSLLYAMGAYADTNNPGYYYADVTRNVATSDGKAATVLLGKQVIWVQDGRLLCAYYPITMTNSEMAEMSSAQFKTI